MNITLQTILSAGGWAGFTASVIFNVIQARRYNRDKDEQRRKEQSPPLFYNVDGNPGPLIVSGKAHSVSGPMMDLWTVVTVVNPTQNPVKITPLRLFLDGEEWLVNRFFFRPTSSQLEQLTRISLRGNDKADFELHFKFSDDAYPHSKARYGEVWFTSDNREQPFSIKVKFS